MQQTEAEFKVRENEKTVIAINLLNIGISVDEISKATGLSSIQIEKLKSEK
jgi:hypothetical protein